MKDCNECNTRDSMYDISGGKKRCWKCGNVWSPGCNIRERPNRPDEAECGHVLLRNGDTTSINGRKEMCSDETHCSGKPRGIKKDKGLYVVVCSRHKD